MSTFDWFALSCILLDAGIGLTAAIILFWPRRSRLHRRLNIHRISIKTQRRRTLNHG